MVVTGEDAAFLLLAIMVAALIACLFGDSGGSQQRKLAALAEDLEKGFND